MFVATILLIMGICLFNVGNDMALMKMGGYVGSHLSKTKKVALMLACSFIIGVIVTIAESDLALLAAQVPAINKWIFIITVALGVGFLLLLATLRILLKVKMKYVLIFAYSVILILMFFIPKQFLPISFDSSGVTTGTLSVPFIMAFGLGISSVRSGENNQEDGFGLLAMCSIGPIFAVMLLSAIFGNLNTVADVSRDVVYNSYTTVNGEFWYQLVQNLEEVALLLLPIILFFVIYNFGALKLPLTQILRLTVGVVYTYVGIVMFFTGAKYGFLPISSVIAGEVFNVSPYLFIPICLVVGLCIAIAEPAVHVLNKQVEDLSSGTITKAKMMKSVSIGLALALTLSAVRIVYEINILWILIPMIVVTVVLSVFCPATITAIAFDSGSVAAGTMSSTFVLPFMQGLCKIKGLDLMTFGFGSIGIIIIVPILIVEIMGIQIRINNAKLAKLERSQDVSAEVTIIEFN